MTAIIILNYNQNDYTLKCVESILALEHARFKLIIVENASSSENAQKLVRGLPVDDRITVHLLEKNIGYVGGVNFGLKEGARFNPNYFLVMNNDTIIDRNALAEMINCCRDNNDKIIVTGKVYHYDEPKIIQDIGYTYWNKKQLEFNRIGVNEMDEGQFDGVYERDMIDDIFWLFPKKLYDEIGGYSDFFWFNAEQVDFALRALKNGFGLKYCSSAKLWHKGSVSIGGRDTNPRLAYYHVQSSLILKYIHLSRVNFLASFFTSIMSTTRTSIKSFILLLKGDSSYLKYGRAKRAGTIYFLKWLVLKNKNNGINPF